jgi:methionyl-tRNA synthetase
MISILLQPTMPAKAAEILDFFGVDPSKRDFAAATYGADLEYARRIEKNNTLFFPPLLVED